MDSSGGPALERSTGECEETTAVDKETAALLRRMDAMLAAPMPAGLSAIEAARARASEIFAAFAGPLADDGSTQFDITIDGAAGPLPARVYRLGERARGNAPVVVFFHGGGWSLGALSDYDILLRSLAAQSGAVIVSVDYRRAPEHKFPAGLNDALAAISSITQRAADLGGDPRRIGVMGDSAGGNLAAVVALALRGSREPVIAAQFLLYPMLDVSRPHAHFASRMAFGGGAHFLTREAIDASIYDYLDYATDAGDPRVSPLNTVDLSDAPPTYIFVGGADPLRDEAEAYARRLREAGVRVAFHEFAGAIHAFLSFGVLASARRARLLLATEIENALG